MNSKLHLTVAAVIERDKQFLMVEETSSGRLVYNQPAGHVEADESLLDAVVREVREETAWGFKPEFLIGVYSWRHPIKGDRIIRFTYSGHCFDHQPNQPLDQGIEQALWLSRDEIHAKEHKLRSPLVTRCLSDYLVNKRFPLDVVQDLDIETALRYAVAV
ncbi:MAG: NUDIX hydrolase [Pseudomonadota bacterium]